MAYVDFSNFKRDTDGDEVTQWYVVLMVAGDESQHTRPEKTANLMQLIRKSAQPQPADSRRWNVGVASPVESEVHADAFIRNLTDETKTRGGSSRSAVFERTARELGLTVENDFNAIFKNPYAEELIERVPTDEMLRLKERRRLFYRELPRQPAPPQPPTRITLASTGYLAGGT